MSEEIASEEFFWELKNLNNNNSKEATIQPYKTYGRKNSSDKQTFGSFEKFQNFRQRVPNSKGNMVNRKGLFGFENYRLSKNKKQKSIGIFKEITVFKEISLSFK